MCGIVGYVGPRRVLPVLMKGLKSLEYRGYDSAGVAWIEGGGSLKVVRARGKLDALDQMLDDFYGSKANIGLGHTRWATHGEPSEINAHPHTDCTGSLVVVHNGIIENYYTLREELTEQGHQFKSQTDTEVLAHLIEKYLEDSLEHAVSRALQDVEGAFALAVLWEKAPDTIVAARKQSPLVLGISDDAAYLASDIPALLPYTKQVIFMEDGELAVIKAGEIKIKDLSTGDLIERAPQTISWDAKMAEKGGYKHFMLKEIYEQPVGVLNTYRGRVIPETGEIDLS